MLATGPTRLQRVLPFFAHWVSDAALISPAAVE